MSRSHLTYVALAILFDLAASLFVGINVAYLMARGLTLLEVGALTILFQVLTMVLEVPAGAFTDTVGHRRAVVASGLAGTISMVIYAASHHLIWFAVGEVFFAIAFSLYSGALEAWVINVSGAMPEAAIQRLFQLGGIATHVAAMVGTAAGGLVALYHLSVPWLLSAFCFVLFSAGALLFMSDTGTQKNRRCSWHNRLAEIGLTIRTGWQFIRRHPRLHTLMAVVFFTEFSLIAVNLYWQPFFQGQSFAVLGLIGAGISLMLMLGAAASLALTRLTGGAGKALLPLLLAIVIFLGLTALQLNQWLSYASFALIFITVGAFEPAFRTVSNLSMTGSIRTTLLSYQYMVGRVGAAFGIFILGGMADRTDIPTSWMLAAGILLIGLPFAYKARNPEDTRHGAVP